MRGLRMSVEIDLKIAGYFERRAQLERDDYEPARLAAIVKEYRDLAEAGRKGEYDAQSETPSLRTRAESETSFSRDRRRPSDLGWGSHSKSEEPSHRGDGARFRGDVQPVVIRALARRPGLST